MILHGHLVQLENSPEAKASDFGEETCWFSQPTSFKQMQSLLNKLNTNIIEVIEIDDKSKANNVNVDKGNSTGTNDDIIMQLQLQSNQNKYDMEDVVLNDHDMLSNEVLDIE